MANDGETPNRDRAEDYNENDETVRQIIRNGHGYAYQLNIMREIMVSLANIADYLRP